MDILQEENGKYAAKIPSTASALSFSGAKIAKLPVIGGQWQHNPSLTSSMHTGYKKVKFMCSSLGKILPRPSDLKLRYVGGETRMVSLPRHINYEAFNRKMVELYGPDIVLKYQLPEEDLDALVSVLSDEDLENMMEECDRLSANEGSSKLRAFIFLASELDIQVLSEIANFKSSERKFVDAINAISDEALSVGNSTGQLYQTSDSFNDAYKAWNGITSQEKDSFFLKNPYSEVLPSEDYVSSGDFRKYESFVPDDLQNSASLFSHSEFMGQPVLSHGLGVPDVFNNDLVSGVWRDSARFFGEGTGHSYGGSRWVTSLETSLPTQPANDDWKEDRVYEVEHSLGESRRGDHGNVWISQDDLKYSRKPDISRLDKASASDPALQNALTEYPTKTLESGDTLKLLVGQLQSDSFALSPGALLQKQLMGSPLNGAPLQKHFHSDWPSNEPSTYVNTQPHFLMNAVEKQPEEVNDHVLQELWEKLPIYDSSSGLDQRNHVFSGIHDDSFGVQSVTAAAVSPLTIENSAAISPANTDPSSPSGWKPRLENNDQNVLLGECSCIVSIASAPPQDSSALSVSLGQVSANIVTSAKPIVELAHVDGTKIPDQSLRQDPGNSYQIFVTKEPDTVFTSQRIDQEALMANRGQLTMPSNLVKGAVPLPIFSDDRVNKLNAIQIENQQSLGSSLPIETRVPGQLIATAAHQHKIDQLDGFSKLEEVSQPASVDEAHRLDMISELLGSTRLTNYLAVTSSTAESFKSRSERSVDEDLRCEEGEKLRSVVKEESLYTANESSDFPPPTFQTTQNSLPSNKLFDKVVSRAFPTNFDDVNSIFADASSLRVTDAVNSPPSQAPAFTSVIESWEATLLQDEDERHKMDHFMQEHEQKQIDRVPAFDKEPEIEDSGVDFEEIEEFQLFDYGQINAAAIAEQEAISRGLQIIRNSDLEELHELGSGTFGTVYHGKWRGTDVAIKRIKASCFAGRQAERDRLVADFWREACILGQLHHPNVVAFYGAVPDGPGATLATVTEYMVNGSLKQVLQNKDRTFDRRKRLLIAMDAAFGMEYLHGKNVVHFDIKCENLLVNLKDTQRPICKVGDLGLSKVKQQTFVSGGVRGTLPWMAPELLNGSSSLVSEKVDVFSFGIVMWELLTGEEPYAHMHYGAIIGGIVNNTLRPTVPRWCDPAWRSLMEKCWAADPNERPTFLEIARTLRAMEASLAAKGPGQARVLEMYN